MSSLAIPSSARNKNGHRTTHHPKAGVSTSGSLQDRNLTAYQTHRADGSPCRVRGCLPCCNLMSDSERAVNAVTPLIAQYKLIRYAENFSCFSKGSCESRLKRIGVTPNESSNNILFLCAALPPNQRPRCPHTRRKHRAKPRPVDVIAVET